MTHRLLVPEAPLSATLLAELERNNDCLFAVAYLSLDGVAVMADAIGKRLNRSRFALRVVCRADDLVTDPAALEKLLELGRRRRGRLQVRWHRDAGFHAKVFAFRASKGAQPTVFVGSANVSGKALGIESGELGVGLARSALSMAAWDAAEAFWEAGDTVTAASLAAYRSAYERRRAKLRAADKEVTQWRKRFRIRRRQSVITRTIAGDSLFIEHGGPLPKEEWQKVDAARVDAKRLYDIEAPAGWYVYEERRDALAVPKTRDIIHVHWRSRDDPSRGASCIRIVRLDRRIEIPNPEGGKYWLLYFRTIRGARASWPASLHAKATRVLERLGLAWRSLERMSGYLRGRRRSLLLALQRLKRLSA
ncbi:MAG TPA: hypothetical protein VMJ10_30215 [Kofleriaceae bacterium]|nr:hypothetical protein [Kofleriaceae bacterium]